MTHPATSMPQKIPILTYHSIDRSGSVISTTPEMFRRQMQHLKKNSFQVVSLTEVVRSLGEGQSVSQRTVAITFDDGYQNFYSEAFPILSDFGFRATVFLVTDFCGQFNPFPANPHSQERRRMLSWDEIKEMFRHGIEFGSHSSTHPDLTRIPIEQAEEEITRSKETIQNRLAAETTVFAYPYGRYNDQVRKLVGQHFAGACTTRLGKITRGCDVYELKRIDMYYLRSYNLFDKLTSNALDWYLQLRQIPREWKEVFAR